MPIKLTFSFPDTAKFILRLAVGIVFVFHGGQKLFGLFGGPGIEGFAGFLSKLQIPFPVVSAYLAGCSEFFCGFALLLGLFARWATLPLIFTMLVGIATVHWKNGFNIMNQGFEYNLVLIAALAAIFLMGPGKWSLMKGE